MIEPKQRWYTVSHPEPGDVATAVFAELDDRKVSRVEGDSVWLQLITSEAGPFPVSNYTYQRRM